MTLYLPEAKLYFLHIPKAGGTSVRGWLQNNIPFKKVGDKHDTLLDIEKKYSVKDHFVVVRNPYARIHSWFYYHVDKAKKWNHKPNRWSYWLDYERKGFNWFIQNTNWMQGDMGKTQTEFFNHKVKFLCYLENIHEDIIPVKRYLNIEADLPLSNKSNKKSIWQNDYDKSSKEIVKEYFYKDFDILGYNQ